MTALSALWLPIVLSAVFVFILSSLIHMMSPWHKGDYPKMEKEAEVLSALRPLAIPPGDYFIPRPSTREEMSTPEFKEKVQKGPVVIMTVMPSGEMGMGRNLGLWFVYLLIIALFSGYIASRALPVGASYRAVFRFAGAAAFLGYTAALWQMSIWYRREWMTTFKHTVDGLIYACLTAGVFGWLWPK